MFVRALSAFIIARGCQRLVSGAPVACAGDPLDDLVPHAVLAVTLALIIAGTLGRVSGFSRSDAVFMELALREG